MNQQTSILNDGELGLVCGGTIPNGYKFCNGTSQGGGPGLYGKNTDCGQTLGEIIMDSVNAARAAVGKPPV